MVTSHTSPQRLLVISRNHTVTNVCLTLQYACGWLVSMAKRHVYVHTEKRGMRTTVVVMVRTTEQMQGRVGVDKMGVYRCPVSNLTVR
jgi:hypothetical protein